MFAIQQHNITTVAPAIPPLSLILPHPPSTSLYLPLPSPRLPKPPALAEPQRVPRPGAGAARCHRRPQLQPVRQHAYRGHRGRQHLSLHSGEGSLTPRPLVLKSRGAAWQLATRRPPKTGKESLRFSGQIRRVARRRGCMLDGPLRCYGLQGARVVAAGDAPALGCIARSWASRNGWVFGVRLALPRLAPQHCNRREGPSSGLS